MSIVVWIVLGLFAGLVGNRLMGDRGDGLALPIGVGITGAVVGGWMITMFGIGTVTDLSPGSALGAIGGSAGLLVLYHFVWRKP